MGKKTKTYGGTKNKGSTWAKKNGRRVRASWGQKEAVGGCLIWATEEWTVKTNWNKKEGVEISWANKTDSCWAERYKSTIIKLKTIAQTVWGPKLWTRWNWFDRNTN